MKNIRYESHISKVSKTSLTDGHPDPKIGHQVYLGPIKRKHCKGLFIHSFIQKTGLEYI